MVEFRFTTSLDYSGLYPSVGANGLPVYWTGNPMVLTSVGMILLICALRSGRLSGAVRESVEKRCCGVIIRCYRAVGCINYAWDDLLTDYKLGLVFWILMPVQDRYGGASRDYWWPKMQCLVAAFREWGCEDL